MHRHVSLGTACSLDTLIGRKLERSASRDQAAPFRSTRSVRFLNPLGAFANPPSYKLILDRIKSQASDQQQQRIQQILMWLSFSFRSLKATEICSAIVFHTDGVLNAQSKLGIGVLDICKPLIEEREDATFALIHHSARE